MGPYAEIEKIEGKAVQKKLRIFSALLILSLFPACATTIGLKEGAFGKHLFDGVPLKPLAAAWSPDSSRIALIRNNLLLIHNTKTGESKVFSDITPISIDWSPLNDLLVVHEKVEGRQLVRMNADKERFIPVTVKEEPYAARWFGYTDKIIVYSVKVKRLSIGTFVTYLLSRVDGGADEVFLSWEAYFPTRSETADFISGWIYPNIRPVHETVLTPQFHDPPALAAFTEFRTSDPDTGMVKDIFKIDDERFGVFASWSPDGSRLAVTDEKGLLIIVDGDNPGSMQPVNNEERGMAPAWNPRGSQIYSGGWLMQSDGTIIKRLIPDAFYSIGVWSPDGKRLAVISEKGLYLFENFSPSFIFPDRPLDTALMQIREKIRILKDLLKEDLISDEEFRARKEGLLKKAVRGE
ncbi:MAG: hypothetical protein ABFR82_16240 [Nitrospirota bacterium]